MHSKDYKKIFKLLTRLARSDRFIKRSRILNIVNILIIIEAEKLINLLSLLSAKEFWIGVWDKIQVLINSDHNDLICFCLVMLACLIVRELFKKKKRSHFLKDNSITVEETTYIKKTYWIKIVYSD